MTDYELSLNEKNKVWEVAKRLLGLNPKAMHRQERNNVETFFEEIADILAATPNLELDRLQLLVDSQKDDIETLNYRISKKEIKMDVLKERIAKLESTE